MKKSGKILSVCGVVLAAGAICGSVLYINQKDAVKTSTSSVEVLTEAPTEAATEPNIDEMYDYVESPEGVSPMAQTLLNQNKDYIGWISIDETDVDYPILMDPGEVQADEGYGDAQYDPNWFYLDHDFYRDSFRAGALFMDYRDVFGSDEKKQSENIVIYGHNMANNTMFGSLRRYRQDLSFVEESPFIDLSSNYKDYQYVIFGLAIESGNWYSDFRFWDMEELNNEKDFNTFVDRIKSDSMVDLGIDVKYGDKLVTLSTCYSDEDNSRFLVVGRRLRDGEIPNDIDSIQRTEEYKKMKEAEKASASSEKTEAESDSDSENSESSDTEENFEE